MKELKELSKIVRFCRKNGISHFKSGDLELQFSANPVSEPAKRQPKLTHERPIIQITKEESERMPTDDEFLMWATPSYDQMVSQREE